MLNEVLEKSLSDKSTSQYKIIEKKYEILKRYLRLYTDKHKLVSREEIELILKALDNEPIEEIKEEETNE
jgi:hypothetical protein